MVIKCNGRHTQCHVIVMYKYALARQIQARMETLKQRLQSDPRFRQGFAKQVAKELQIEQQLEAQLVKQVCVCVCVCVCVPHTYMYVNMGV